MNAQPVTLYVFGRLRGITRQHLEQLVVRNGWHLADEPGPSVTLVAVASGTALRALKDGPQLRLPRGIPAGAQAVSERGLRRLLGLAPPQAIEARLFDWGTMARLAEVDRDLIEALALYNVLDPAEGDFGYRDLVCARQVRRLLEEGLSLPDIVRASCALQRAGKSLADTRLSQGEWGEIIQDLGNAQAHLDGQLSLALGETFETADDLFARAEQCEAAGDLAEAQRWYGRMLQIDRTDPVVPFNLANVLHACGRLSEAVLSYLEALRRDPCFADAWVNLGIVREEQQDPARARECYAKALSARSDCPEALFNLGLLLTSGGKYDEALPLWERYMSLPVIPEQFQRGRRLKKLCELELYVEKSGGADRLERLHATA